MTLQELARLTAVAEPDGAGGALPEEAGAAATAEVASLGIELEQDSGEALTRLLDLVHQRHGHDFRGYATSSIGRRIGHLMVKEGLPTLEALLERVASDDGFLPALLNALTVSVTEMFRDPDVFLAFRRRVIPFLRTYPRIKIWLAGIATGEEAYSMAMLLGEEGLLGRTVIHATDLNPAALARAREGIYPAGRLRRYAENYLLSGGRGSFSSHFVVAHGHAAIDAALKAAIHFTDHNLVSDHEFGQMQAVFCRNVLIYFKQPLQERALSVLDASLVHGGFLCLGSGETLARTRLGEVYQELVPQSRLYRKSPPSQTSSVDISAPRSTGFDT